MIKKNRTDKWLKALGLQLPSAITKYGSINSISEKTNVVNSSISENSQSDTTRYSIDVDNLYSYNNLVSKPDMKIVAIDEDFARNGNIVDRKEILKQAKKENSVYVDDLKENVNITRNGILHFTEKTIKLSSSAVLDIATITPHISEILKNSIVVNELSARPGKNKDIKKSFVLIGIATDTNNDYLVRTIVDKYSNDVLRCDFYNLYATKAKKEEMLGRSPSAVGDNSSNTVPSLNISISDLLQNVKDVGLVTSVLSEDVCNKLGVNRPDSVFKNDLKYSIDVPLEGEVYDTIPPGEKAARKVRVPKKVDGTYTNRFVRTIMEHGDISEYQAELLNDGVWHEAEKFRHKVADDKSAIEYAQNRVKDGSAEEEFRKFSDGIIKKPGYMKKAECLSPHFFV